MNQGLDLVLLASPSAAFLLLLTFGLSIFNFHVKFVSPSSSTTRISPKQYPDNARTSCLIFLCTLLSLHKCTLRSSSYSSFEILYRRWCLVIEMLRGDHQQLADLEMSISRTWKSVLPYLPRNLYYYYCYHFTSQYCIGFASHQHESATLVHLFPIPNPPLMFPHTIT